MTRIAFTLIGGKSWTGGYNYLLNLLRVISQRRPGMLSPVLFIGTDVDHQEVAPFRCIKGVEIVTSPHMNGSRRIHSLLRSLVRGFDPAMQHIFHEHRIEVLFENAHFYGARIGIPAIAWIPDFQHREIPHLFSPAAWWRRELGFRAQIAAGRAIMLSSHSALNACVHNYPATIGRTYVVRFAVPSEHPPSLDDVHKVRESYGLPERYFYLPNQFWQHKNHLLVIDALALLKRDNPDIVVAASGKQLDPNNPKHFQQILSRREAADLKDQLRLLGLIPYEHVAPLMLGSVALLNPSLYEGWSTTVEEARALRVSMLLSNLDVHQEQAKDIARFFDPTSASSLADALLQAWRSKSPKTHRVSNISNIFADPVERFVDDFIYLVQHVAGATA